MIFPGTSTSSAAREAIVQHPYISLQVGTSLVAMLIEIVESPLTEYYLQRVMQERQMEKKMQKAKGNLSCVQFHTTKPISGRNMAAECHDYHPGNTQTACLIFQCI